MDRARGLPGDAHARLHRGARLQDPSKWVPLGVGAIAGTAVESPKRGLPVVEAGDDGRSRRAGAGRSGSPSPRDQAGVAPGCTARRGVTSEARPASSIRRWIVATPLVIRRIEAWEAAGLIDAETADRLREAEADVLPEPEAAEARAPGAGRALGVTAVELFVYLGAAFVLAAWYALVASTNPSWEDSSARFAAASLIAADRARRPRALPWPAAMPASAGPPGVAFLVALPTLGTGIYLLADTLHPDSYQDPPTNALVASIVVLVAALGARRVVPALTTQLGLAAAAVTVGGFAMGWFDAVLFPRGAAE